MSNRFDERYDIRLARYEEISDLMEFIDEYWKKDHILAKDRDFFMYEMVIDEQVNFLIAKDRNTSRIDGIIGFLPCSESAQDLDVWGVVWKTVPDAMPMLGIELMKRLPDAVGARTVLGVGANSRTAVPLLARICHFYTAKMKHYYRLNDLSEYKIAKINQKYIPAYEETEDLEVTKISDRGKLETFFDFSSVKDQIPYKDAWYYTRRFLDHPVYEYDIYGLNDGVDKALITIRKQKQGEGSVLRIVDYIGGSSLFGKCGSFFDSLLEENEYIDFYFDGFENDLVKKAGLVDIEECPNIIPDYFHPFEQSNVDIYVVSSNNTDKCLFFKADGDQDRPN